MFELERHIESLLLENDCVIVPDFGGFVTYYSAARWSSKESTFLPPARIIGFNQQLKMNDGMLVQSYMKAYNTNFPDATKILEGQVARLNQTLHEEGKVELPNIGEIICSVHDAYTFKAYDYRITSPLLYGLDTLEIQELKNLQKPAEKKIAAPETHDADRWSMSDFRVNWAYVRNTAAVAAAIIFFFFLSTPIENTYIEKESYAQLVSSELLNKLDKESLLTTSIPFGGRRTSNEVKPAEKESDKKSEEVLKEVPEVQEENPEVRSETPEVQRETPEPPKPEVVPAVVKKPYHLIVASVLSRSDANKKLQQLKAQGYKDAQLLVSGERIRVSILSFSTREEADRQLLQLRKNNEYRTSWLFVK